MYSFDVVTLFTNIPLQFTIQLILDTIFKDNIETFNDLNKEILKTFTQLGNIKHNFTILREILQANGWVAMGSSIAPMLADEFMNYVMKEAVFLCYNRTGRWYSSDTWTI